MKSLFRLALLKASYRSLNFWLKRATKTFLRRRRRSGVARNEPITIVCSCFDRAQQKWFTLSARSGAYPLGYNPKHTDRMHEQQPVNLQLNCSVGSVCRRSLFVYVALFALFLTTVPVRSFTVDFSPHRMVRHSTVTQKRLTQASDACRYCAPARQTTPAPPPEPVAHETVVDVPVLIAHFNRSSFYRPPPIA